MSLTCASGSTPSAPISSCLGPLWVPISSLPSAMFLALRADTFAFTEARSPIASMDYSPFFIEDELPAYSSFFYSASAVTTPMSKSV